jgi:1,4-dihydroxy-2-naphthoate octaprenyltransferase
MSRRCKDICKFRDFLCEVHRSKDISEYTDISKGKDIHGFKDTTVGGMAVLANEIDVNNIAQWKAFFLSFLAVPNIVMCNLRCP